MLRQIIYTNQFALEAVIENDTFARFIKKVGRLKVNFDFEEVSKEDNPRLASLLDSRFPIADNQTPISAENLKSSTNQFESDSIILFEKLDKSIKDELKEETGRLVYDADDINTFFDDYIRPFRKVTKDWKDFFKDDNIPSEGRTFAIINDRFLFFHENAFSWSSTLTDSKTHIKEFAKFIYDQLIVPILPKNCKNEFHIIFLVDVKASRDISKEEKEKKIKEIEKLLSHHILALKSPPKIEFIFYEYRVDDLDDLHDRWIYFNHHYIGGLQNILPYTFRNGKRTKQSNDPKEWKWRFDGWEELEPNSDVSSYSVAAKDAYPDIIKFCTKKGVSDLYIDI